MINWTRSAPPSAAESKANDPMEVDMYFIIRLVLKSDLPGGHRMFRWPSVVHFGLFIFGLYAIAVAYDERNGKSIHSARYAIFLKVLREQRLQAGLTQVQLARRLRETQTFVSKCERGERRIDVVELKTFCSAFKIPLKQFVARLERELDKKS